ncbi:methyltransferase type 11 [Calothrix sp. HK-06]|nr:methyltransferase type 11 [Calothrix sp. HK-06]
MASNKETFSTIDFDYWACIENLSIEEKFIIETYLDKKAKTLEAGTGGGRIALEMQKMDFKSLFAFDYIPEFIEHARQRDKIGSISFAVEDASALTYQNDEFEQLVYLQQVLCSIENQYARLSAFKEAYRILKKGGTAIFSFLSYESRIQSNLHKGYLTYIQLLRKIFNSEFSSQYISRMKLAGKPNFGAIFDQQPHMYWYRIEEVYQLFQDVNFKIVAFGTDYQLRERKMLKSLEYLQMQPIEGMLYFICEK